MNDVSFKSNKTGMGTAALRALESDCAVLPLINDPFAVHFAGEEGFQWTSSLSVESLNLMIDLLAVRTRVIDDFCNGFTLNKNAFYPTLNLTVSDQLLDTFQFEIGDINGSNQLVILGSGFDSRAFRLNCLGNTNVYELDLDSNIRYKQSIISRNNFIPICNSHTLLSIDFDSESIVEILTNSGFNRKVPTIWLMEGLTGYLSESIILNIADQISFLSYQKSIVIATFIGQSIDIYGKGTGKSKSHSYFTNEGGRFFQNYGWKVGQKRIKEFANLYNRIEYLNDYNYWIVYSVK